MGSGLLDLGSAGSVQRATVLRLVGHDLDRSSPSIDRQHDFPQTSTSTRRVVGIETTNLLLRPAGEVELLNRIRRVFAVVMIHLFKQCT